jgi:FKBP-type peptidyl-prolyl cis-trans isomerase
MKKIIITALLPLCAIAVNAQTAKKRSKPGAKTVAPVTFKNNLDSASYSFGTAMAGSLKANGLTALNYQLFLKGIQDAFGGKPLLISADKSQLSINEAFKAASMKKNAPLIAEGKNFLSNNKKQAGIQTTASGLQYQIITKGTGVAPKITDTVTVHYKGTLLNGKEFDSSYKRNEPTTFPLNGVIAGWTEGVQLMQTGAKYKFFIPYDLAYGDRGAGQGEIPPFSTLIFEIELLKVNGK